GRPAQRLFLSLRRSTSRSGTANNLRSRFVARNQWGAEFANKGRTTHRIRTRTADCCGAPPRLSVSSSFKAKVHAILAIRPDPARPRKSVLVRQYRFGPRCRRRGAANRASLLALDRSLLCRDRLCLAVSEARCIDNAAAVAADARALGYWRRLLQHDVVYR